MPPVPGSPHGWFPGVGRWFIVATPVVAGLLDGPLAYRFAREARGHCVPEVMLVVARNGGRIRPQVAAVKALASALCIAGGGSVGREGPIVQICSATGSSLAQLCGSMSDGSGCWWPAGRRRHLGDVQRPGWPGSPLRWS